MLFASFHENKIGHCQEGRIKLQVFKGLLPPLEHVATRRPVKHGALAKQLKDNEAALVHLLKHPFARGEVRPYVSPV